MHFNQTYYFNIRGDSMGFAIDMIENILIKKLRNTKKLPLQKAKKYKEFIIAGCNGDEMLSRGD